MLENQKVFDYYSQRSEFQLFYLSRERHRGQKYQYFGQYIDIFRKKEQFSCKFG